MKAIDKAKELFNKVNEYTHGYMGSSMLSNIEFEDLKINRSKNLATLVVNEILLTEPRNPSNVDWDECKNAHDFYYQEREQAKKYWEQVKNEIEQFNQ